MGEFEFIAKVKNAFAGIGCADITGIGDDCAIMPVGGGESLVFTTDMLLEGVHFLRVGTSAHQLGRKSLAVNLSDVAAMGARPVATLLSLGLPADCTGAWADEFMAGYRELSQQFGVALIGGDTTSSKSGIAVNVVAIGRTPDHHLKRRGGAKPGDLIVVAGWLGESAAGLADILAGNYDTPFARIHNDPQPQVSQGQWLGAQQAVGAMIDLSDGLASDLRHILEASGVGAQIDLEAIPTRVTLEQALCGGEDYKLLFTVDKAGAAGLLERYRAEMGEAFVVGNILQGGSQITWRRDGKRVSEDWQGFTHF